MNGLEWDEKSPSAIIVSTEQTPIQTKRKKMAQQRLQNASL